jgi:23S rRNA pseudouridine1911/1915/1917 synthase
MRHLQINEITMVASERLDVYLAQQLPELSRSRIQKLIEQGQVRVNQHVCASKKYLVQAGDNIGITLPEPTETAVVAEVMALDILYEDDDFLILNKPAGLVVHPAPGHGTGTLVNGLLSHCANLSGIGGVQRPGIVHRLDKDTTGTIAIAKTEFAHQHLQAQIQAKTARREYLGIVFGAPKMDAGTIDIPIGRHRVDRKKQAVVLEGQGGRHAVTHWRVQERLGNYTLMHFQLETGRTHQIRVHSAHLGYPIVGDPLYSSGKSMGVNLTGQALHAWRLTLAHPRTGELVCATAPIPAQMQKLIVALRLR